MNTASAIEIVKNHLATRRLKSLSRSTARAKQRAANPPDVAEVLAMAERGRDLALIQRSTDRYAPAAMPSARLVGNVFTVGVMTPDQAKARLASWSRS